MHFHKLTITHSCLFVTQLTHFSMLSLLQYKVAWMTCRHTIETAVLFESFNYICDGRQFHRKLISYVFAWSSVYSVFIDNVDVTTRHNKLVMLLKFTISKLFRLRSLLKLSLLHIFCIDLYFAFKRISFRFYYRIRRGRMRIPALTFENPRFIQCIIQVPLFDLRLSWVKELVGCVGFANLGAALLADIVHLFVHGLMTVNHAIFILFNHFHFLMI